LPAFLFGIDARALGMGEAFVALANTYSASYWNPAGLTFTESIRFGGTTGKPINQDGAGIMYAGAVLPLSWLAFGVNFGQVELFGGGREQLILGSLAIRPSESFALGLNVNTYRHELAGATTDQKAGVDLGMMVQLLSILKLGLSVSDLTRLTENSLPSNRILEHAATQSIRVGMAFQALKNAVIWGFQWNANDRSVRVGLELNPLRALRFTSGAVDLAFRIGVLKPEQGDKQPILGFGLRLLFGHADVALLLKEREIQSVVVSGGLRF
jgi:hypothetical protein